ncbi:putative UDP-glucuronate 4-epimerase [Helianthus anomalus]
MLLSSLQFGFVNLLEICKTGNPQCAIVCTSLSSINRLNTKISFLEKDRTNQPASFYGATKKAGEEIAYTYNHIYGLSLTGLQFFTVYMSWGRPDMAYFFFTEDIMKGKVISVFEVANHKMVARDFTYIDDIVKGCLGALHTTEKNTWSGREKRGPVQLCVFNLGNTPPVPVSDLVGNGDVSFTYTTNISLARREFGYRPMTDLQTGLKKYVRWYVSYYVTSGEKKVD